VSDLVLAGLIAAGPPTLAAVLVYIKTNAVEKKTDKIHDLTNSNLTAVKTELVAANSRIDELNKLIVALIGQLGK
jgi:hypothetical protein